MYIPIVCFSLWLNSVSLCGFTTLCLFIHLLMDIWIVASFELYKQSCYEYPCPSLCMDLCFLYCWLSVSPLIRFKEFLFMKTFIILIFNFGYAYCLSSFLALRCTMPIIRGSTLAATFSFYSLSYPILPYSIGLAGLFLQRWSFSFVSFPLSVAI